MQIVLSSSSGVPMYEQIKTQVRTGVHGGQLEQGDRLPSLRQLAADLRVSLMTVTRAYNDLVAEGLVSNEHGRGFVVRPIDPDVARTALELRVEEASLDLARAARSARLTVEESHRRLDLAWKQID